MLYPTSDTTVTGWVNEGFLKKIVFTPRKDLLITFSRQRLIRTKLKPGLTKNDEIKMHY